MTQSDFKSPRLFVDSALHAGGEIALERDQSNYLGNVLRLGAGDTVLVFNGRDGEWRAVISGRKHADLLTIQDQTRLQPAAGDLRLLVAPPFRPTAHLYGVLYSERYHHQSIFSAGSAMSAYSSSNSRRAHAPCLPSRSVKVR